MIYFDNVDKWKNIWKKFIDKEDLYNPEDSKYGIEYEPHLTLTFGFDLNTTDEEDIRRFVHRNKLQETIPGNIKFKSDSITLFENDEYDVLKFDIQLNEYLTSLYKKINKEFDIYSEYDTFEPHITIAFLKKGSGEKYLKKFENVSDVNFKPLSIVYSGRNKSEKITFKL